MPDTGQKLCYDVSGHEITCPSSGQALFGQDANYSINPMSYTKLDDAGNALPDSAESWSMVKDNVTGLTWEMKTNLDRVINYTDPHDADNVYTWYDSNSATNGGNPGTPGDGTDTQDFIAALNDAHYGGYSDWRLPTLKELAYIVNYLTMPVSTIDTTYFPNTVTSFYWSATTRSGSAGDAWVLDFSAGSDDMIAKSGGYFVRAVRGGQTVSFANADGVMSDTRSGGNPPERSGSGGYIDNGNGTVTDIFTGLMWQKNISSEAMSWEKALEYCEALNTGNHTDWRLPDIKELRSLVDYSQKDPAIDGAYFPNTVLSFYWSSTTSADNTTNVCGIGYEAGSDADNNKAGVYYVRAVRAGQPGSANYLIVDPTSRAVSKDAGSTTFSVSYTGTDTMPWTASVTSGGDWLTITSGASGANTGAITCAFTANPVTTARTATIRVTATGATGSPKDVTITQAGQLPQPILSVTPSSQNVVSDAGTIGFTVSNTGTGTMSWTAAVTGGGNWLTIQSGASGTNTGTITCAFTANPGTINRKAAIRVTATGATGSPKDVTVTQMGSYFPIDVADTGQTKCYNNTAEIACPSSGQPFYGQDAHFNINPMSYTKLDGSGKVLPITAASWVMVKDNITGLIWETKTHLDGVKNFNDPHDADNTYTWYDSNTATNGGNPGIAGSGTDTEDFIEALNDAKYGGYTDWRLPTALELPTIVNHSILGTGPSVDIGYFPNTRLSWYWTSTPQIYDPTNAWGVYLDGGYGNGPKSYAGYVCAVRGGQSGTALSGRYKDNGDGTITDNATELTWQQDGATIKNWEQALSYCEGLSLGGQTGWRLPSLKELQTLADYSVKNSKAAIDIEYFPNTAASFYWSSTTNGKSINGAWGINFSYGFDIYVVKTDSGNIRAVRGGQTVPMGNLSVTPSSLSVMKDSGTAAFSISNTGTGAMSWTAVVTSGGNWLRITSGIGGTAAGSVSVAYDANSGTGSRTGTIRITASNATESPNEITIVQSGAPSQFLGAWPDAVYSWNAVTNKWIKIPSTAGALMIAAGKVDNDAVDDLIGVWSSGLYIRQSSNGQWINLGSAPTWIAVGDLTNDGRDDIIGSWAGGVYVRDSSTGQWTKLSAPAKQLATGNIGGTRDDLAGVWSDGLWVRYSANASWKKLDAAIPVWITTADMTGTGRADIVGSYSTGTWYRNSATGAWTKVTTSAEQLASGDLDGDGRDDLIGIWSNSVYVRYGASGKWQQIAASKPRWITTGRLAKTVQAADSLDASILPDDPMRYGGEDIESR